MFRIFQGGAGRERVERAGNTLIKTKVCLTQQRGAVHLIRVWGTKENSQDTRLHTPSPPAAGGDGGEATARWNAGSSTVEAWAS